MHLIVIQNGLNSWHYSMNSIKMFLEEYLNEDYKIIISDVNNFNKTWYGIEGCGKRLCLFVNDICKTYNVKYISFIGHSFGGLIIRNCIGHLNNMNFFDNVIPILYTSIATPHLGIYYISKSGKFMAKYLIGSTGKELLIEDENKILIEMSKENTSYYKGLQKFRSILLYSNIKNDKLVSFESGCIIPPLKHDKNIPLEQVIDVNPYIDCISPINYIWPETIYINLLKLPLIRKGIDISNHHHVHNSIINKGRIKQTSVLEDILKYL